MRTLARLFFQTKGRRQSAQDTIVASSLHVVLLCLHWQHDADWPRARGSRFAESLPLRGACSEMWRNIDPLFDSLQLFCRCLWSLNLEPCQALSLMCSESLSAWLLWNKDDRCINEFLSSFLSFFFDVLFWPQPWSLIRPAARWFTSEETLPKFCRKDAVFNSFILLKDGACFSRFVYLSFSP